MTSRRLLVGVAVAAVYVFVALWFPAGPARPLLDVGPPLQPYQWVNPPALYAEGNVTPHTATRAVKLDAGGSEAQSLATPDGQAALIVREGSFLARAGEKQISVRIDPLDPATIGPPPSGLRYDGNAYRFTATYDASKAVAGLAKPATIVLRFPILATKLFRRETETWKDLNATPVGANLQVFSDTDALGTFVAVGPPLTAEQKKKKNFPTALLISIAAAAVAAAAGLTARLRARRRRAGAKRARPKTVPKRRPPRRR